MSNEPKASDINSELTDAQLEQAAGGYSVRVKHNPKNRRLCIEHCIPWRTITFSTADEAKDYIATLQSYGMEYDIYT